MEYLAKTMIILPIYTSLKNDEICFVIESINYILKGADKAGYDYKNWKPMFTHSTNGLAVIKPDLISLDNIMKNKPQMISTGNNIYGYDMIMALASDILGWNTKMVWGNNSKGKFKAFMSTKQP